MNWRERISVNPAVCHGKACVTDTRVLVSTIRARYQLEIPYVTKSALIERLLSVAKSCVK